MRQAIETIKDVFAGKKSQNSELEGFTDLYFNVFDILEYYIEKGRFDRYKVLGSCKSDNKKEELIAYKIAFDNMMKEIHGCLDNYLQQRNIWVIFNYYSLFLKIRLNVLKTPAMKTVDVKPRSLEPMLLDTLSWYDIFGRINRNTILKLVKSDSKVQSVSIIEHQQKNQFVMYLPEGNGWNAQNTKNSQNYNMSYYNKFVTALTKNNIVEIGGQKKPYLYNTRGLKLLKTVALSKIVEVLFSKKNMADWDKECLIYSDKFDTDFADSLEYFPNFLFFKEKGSFSEEDEALCHGVNRLCVKVSTRMLIFENDLLLDRIEDLVDSKPKRIFDELDISIGDSHREKRKIVDVTNDSGTYVEQIKKVFDCFITDHLRKTHPLIKNDLSLAFYLYRTSFFKTDSSYLDVPAWVESSDKRKYSDWRDYYIKQLAKLKEKHERKKSIFFDFKQFVFDSVGEKFAIEFERISADKIVERILNTSEKERKEFEEILICDNADIVDPSLRKEYNAYLRSKLLVILNDMDVRDKDKKDLELIIGDGSPPADYFSIFCHETLVSIGYKYIYYIPSLNYDGGSSGGFSFFCRNKWPRSITKAAQDWATRFGTTFSEIEGRKIVAREIVKHGTKAAMTAIMSRNLSHNVGSHVLSYHTQDSSLGSDDRLLYQYIQHRMDFLAEVTTSGPTWEMTFDFQIDIMQEFYNQRILLEKICHSEGKTVKKGDFTVRQESLCKRISIPNGLIGKHAFFSIIENFIRNAAKHYKNDTNLNILIELKVPNNLRLPDKPEITNLLKKKCEWVNSGNYLKFKTENERWDFLTDDEIESMYPAKHDVAENCKKELREFCEKQKLFIELRIWDNRPDSCRSIIVKDENGSKKKGSVAEKLRKFISGEDAELINHEDGSIKRGGWGIKEMHVSAAFLRKFGPEILLEKDSVAPPLMEVLCGDPNSADCVCPEDTDESKKCRFDSDYKNKLCYRFYLRRPKDMLVIADNSAIADGEFELEGMKASDLWDKCEGGDERLKKEIPHRLLLVDESDLAKYRNDSFAPFVPCRTMTYNNTGNSVSIADGFYLEQYQEFIKKVIMNNGNSLPQLCYVGTLEGGGGGFFCNIHGVEMEIPQDIRSYFKRANDKEWKWKNGELCGINGKKYISAPQKTFKETLVFYYHAETANERTNLEKLLEVKINVQPVSGGYSTATKLESIPMMNGTFQKHFIFELIEAALTRVVIVDERVSEWAKGNLSNGVEKRKILDKMNLFIVEVNTKKVSVDDITTKINNIPSDKNSEKTVHFFVIHQGILDKFEEDEAGSSINFMNEAVNEMSRWKVVASGRGIPSNLFEDVRFIEVSALLKMLMEFDKHGLVQTLYSLRRPWVEVGQK